MRPLPPAALTWPPLRSMLSRKRCNAGLTSCMLVVCTPICWESGRQGWATWDGGGGLGAARGKRPAGTDESGGGSRGR